MRICTRCSSPIAIMDLLGGFIMINRVNQGTIQGYSTPQEGGAVSGNSGLDTGLEIGDSFAGAGNQAKIAQLQQRIQADQQNITQAQADLDTAQAALKKATPGFWTHLGEAALALFGIFGSSRSSGTNAGLAISSIQNRNATAVAAANSNLALKQAALTAAQTKLQEDQEMLSLISPTQ